jgi:cell division protein FtsB
MRDIGRRIQRHRLTRYAPAQGMHVPRWAWFALGAWLLWAGVLSDHSFYQLWRLERISAREHARLRESQEALRHLDYQARDGNERKRIAERLLREQEGWSRPGEIIFRIDEKAPAPSKD